MRTPGAVATFNFRAVSAPEAARKAVGCAAAPIKTIVNDLGFPSSSAFCKFFKRTTGTTPMAYRRSSRLARQSPEPR